MIREGYFEKVLTEAGFRFGELHPTRCPHREILDREGELWGDETWIDSSHWVTAVPGSSLDKLLESLPEKPAPVTPSPNS